MLKQQYQTICFKDQMTDLLISAIKRGFDI